MTRKTKKSKAERERNKKKQIVRRILHNFKRYDYGNDGKRRERIVNNRNCWLAVKE